MNWGWSQPHLEKDSMSFSSSVGRLVILLDLQFTSSTRQQQNREWTQNDNWVTRQSEHWYSNATNRARTFIASDINSCHAAFTLAQLTSDEDWTSYQDNFVSLKWIVLFRHQNHRRCRQIIKRNGLSYSNGEKHYQYHITTNPEELLHVFVLLSWGLRYLCSCCYWG